MQFHNWIFISFCLSPPDDTMVELWQNKDILNQLTNPSTCHPSSLDTRILMLINNKQQKTRNNCNLVNYA